MQKLEIRVGILYVELFLCSLYISIIISNLNAKTYLARAMNNFIIRMEKCQKNRFYELFYFEIDIHKNYRTVIILLW